MAYEVKWYIEKRVLSVRQHGIVTMDEARELNILVLVHLMEGVAPIHVVVDVTELKAFPNNPIALKRAIQSGDPARVGWTLIAGVNPILRYVTSLLFKFWKVRYRMFATMDEVYAFLGQIDESLIVSKLEG